MLDFRLAYARTLMKLLRFGLEFVWGLLVDQLETQRQVVPILERLRLFVKRNKRFIDPGNKYFLVADELTVGFLGDLSHL